jgi:hypothetical protein
MVQKGLLSVELIDAVTKEPFREHKGGDDSVDKHCVDSFVEVEPGSEYFLRIANDSSSTIICNITVDGSDLGYEFCLGPNEYDDKGLWTLVDGTSQHTALKVDKVIASVTTETPNPNSEIGIVNVDFFEFVDGDGTEIANDFKSDWNGTKQAPKEAQSVDDDTKRLVKSQQGSHSETLSNDDGKRKVYSYGEAIETARLKYCTAVGLIVEGVLVKPPLWDWARMTQKKDQNHDTEEVLKVNPQILKRNTCDGDGNVIEIKEFEMFDLTSVDG